MSKLSVVITDVEVHCAGAQGGGASDVWCWVLLEALLENLGRMPESELE